MSKRITRWFLFQKFAQPVLAMAFLLIVGTAGYVYLNDYNWLDALYMTVITIGTVGFGEVLPLNDAGKLFTIFLILGSVSIVGYYLAMITRILLDGEWRKQYILFKQAKKLKGMHNHVIVCGYGRNGKKACEILAKNHIDHAVIEERQQYAASIPSNVELIVQGDATKDETLIDAGILKAKALISALPDDADNLFVVLTARQLNPNLLIISRASDDHTIKKLKIAGANNVIMPDKLGGVHMASLVMIPDVHEFLSMLSTQQTDEFRVAEIVIKKTVSLGDLNLWQQTGCNIIGIKKADGQYLKNPPPTYHSNVGEILIVMGSQPQIDKAKKMLK